MKRGKKYSDKAEKVDRQKQYSLDEGLELLKSLTNDDAVKFDETIELAIRLGIDPRNSDQMLRGTIDLPAGTGRQVRVAVFAQGPAAQAARDAGADVVGDEDLVKQVSDGDLGFDVVIAEPSMMSQVGKLGRVLGPRGLMPNPKTGTVTNDIAKAVEDFKGGKVSYRTDRFGNVHVPIGKASFENESLVQNFTAVLDELQRAKPPAAKGRYFLKVSMCSTMGPSVKINPTA